MAVELMKLLVRGVNGFKAEVRKRLIVWAIKLAVLLLLLGLAHCALLFGLGALALYLNNLFGNSYQGFLIVSGGCMAFLLLFFLLYRIHGRK